MPQGERARLGAVDPLERKDLSAQKAVDLGIGNQLDEATCVARSLDFIGDPGRIRTCDPQIRNLMLYPAELRGQPLGLWFNSIIDQYPDPMARWELSRHWLQRFDRPGAIDSL